MAHDDFIATGNPAWLLVGDDEADEVAADLAVEDIRHGPATVAQVVLTYGNHEAGTELTLPNVLAAIAALEKIAAQAVIDGYGIPNTLVPGESGTPWLREDAAPERPADTFREYYVAQVGEVDNGSEVIVEQLDDRAEYDDHDRIYWTLYGVHQDGTSEALFDADTEDEVMRVARLLPGLVYRADHGAYTLVQGA